MMDVGIWRTSYSYPVSLVREVPGRWNDGYQSLCFLVTTTVFPNEINLISEWFAMTGFSVLCRELLLCSTSSGNGVEIVRGGDALLLGSVRVLEHRGGHWSSSMKSFSAKSSRYSKSSVDGVVIVDGILVVVGHSFSSEVGSFCLWMFVFVVVC